MNRARKWLVACVFAGVLLIPTLVPSAAAASSLPPLGMSMEAVKPLKAAGAAPRYGSFWVGPWTASSGWDALDNALRLAKAEGVTPVVYWYYWGDSITPSCVEHGCDGRTRAQWTSMTRTLAQHVRDQMGGAETIIVLENEFNKGGITGDYASTFDWRLEAVAKDLRAVPGVKLVLGFGAWGEDSWTKFPKSAAQSHYIGFQMMRASTKDTETEYRGAAARIEALTQHVAAKFGKPAFLYDLALSSYPDARWERIQAETLDAVFRSLATSGATGLQGVVYRTLVDNPYMDPANYYGYAERHWGLKKAFGGGDKPAWAVWKAKATSTSVAPSAFSATFSGVKVDEWWVQTGVSANKALAKVEARVDGGAWIGLTNHGWGWARSFHVGATQVVEFRATATDGSVATSGAYARGGAPAQPPFTASFGDRTVDEWWVQTSVTASRDLARVEARVDGGAWIALDKKSWGAYAMSFQVKTGQHVEFRATATDGSSVVSEKYGRGGGVFVPFQASFSDVSVSEWWVQATVKANEPLAKVEARVSGGAWTTLDKKSWGAYAKSFQVKTGQYVELRATSAGGATAWSAKYWR